jgi:hypothetical protein
MSGYHGRGECNDECNKRDRFVYGKNEPVPFIAFRATHWRTAGSNVARVSCPWCCGYSRLCRYAPTWAGCPCYLEGGKCLIRQHLRPTVHNPHLARAWQKRSG